MLNSKLIKNILQLILCSVLLLHSDLLGQTTVEISPQATNVLRGMTFSVDVVVQNINVLHAASIRFSFDNTMVNYTGIVQGSFLSSNGDMVFFSASPSPGPSVSSVTVDQAILGLGYVAGSGTLFRINFVALQQIGTSDITLLAVDLRDTINLSVPATKIHGQVSVVTPTFFVNPGTLSFQQVVLSTNKLDSVTVTNPGTSLLTISSVQSDHDNFTVNPTSGSLASSASMKFYVTFQPSSTGTKNGNLIFTHDADGSPDSVLLSGVGTEPLFMTVPISLEMGAVVVTASKTDSFLVTNPGSATLHITTVNSDNDEFTVIPISESVLPSESKKFYVTFNPISGGMKTSNIILQHDASTSPDTVTVSGIGVYVGEIKGMKFDDTNGNGIKETSEVGISNWKITISGTIAETTLTNSSGYFTFDSLVQGTYSVTEVLQNGWQQTTQNSLQITLGVNQRVENINFGNFKIAKIHGKKINDSNGNGQIDAGESGLAGWTIQATKNQTTKTTTTDSDGLYTLNFYNDETGIWIVSEIPQTDWVQTYPPTTTYSISIQSGTDTANNDFGNYQQSSISGQVMNDLMEDSVTNGDAGLSGWIVKLFLNGQLVERRVTSGSGGYSFGNLSPATYIVQESLHTGWLQTIPRIANAVPPVSDLNAGPRAYSVIIQSGNVITGRDFANYKYGYISGTKFNDVNGNSIKEISEEPLSDWTILLKKGGVVINSTITDVSGNYQFANLHAGTYETVEQQQIGWYQTIPVGSYVLDVFSGVNITGKDFGNFQFGSVQGFAFNDRDSNGVYNPLTEQPRDSAKIIMSGTQAPAETIMTNSLGAFMFDSISAGTYSLRQIQTATWHQTLPAGGASYNVTITSGLDTTGFTFGSFQMTDTMKFRTFSVKDYNKVATTRNKRGYSKRPTAGNVRDSVFLNRGFSLDEPRDSGYLCVGVPRTDSMGFYGWLHYSFLRYRSSSVRSMIYDLRSLRIIKPRNKPPYAYRPANYLWMVGEKTLEKYFSKYGNHLTVELIALKTNVAASDLGIIPSGFGDLVYCQVADAESTMNGKTIRQIISMTDTALTMGRLIRSVGDTVYRYPRSYLNILDSVVSRLNLAFYLNTAKLDTVSTKPLVLKGIKPLYKVPFLRRDPSLTMRLTKFEPAGLLDGQPQMFRLDQNYPNPFNPMTTIEFELEQPSFVTLKIFNVLGQEVATLFDQQEMSEGMQAIEFDATNFASGVYFYKLEAKEIDSDITTFN
jgi:hypothetical protein